MNHRNNYQTLSLFKKGFFTKLKSEEDITHEQSVEIIKLNNTIKETTFMYQYNEKMLQGIIRNNEKLIDRYLSLSAENAERIKLAIDEFKTNLSNMNEGLQQMTHVVNDLTQSTIKQNEFCKQILDDIDILKNNNQLSFTDMQHLNGNVQNLRENSTTLHELVINVEDVADRLRYMSFNGKIQAASLEHIEKKLKGSNGGEVAGFSVVASQMENLSNGVASLVDRQNSSTSMIINNIESLVNLSKRVESLDQNNLTSVKEVAGYIGQLHDELGSVASSSEELSATAEEFASSIEELYAAIESISRGITDFYLSLMKEVRLYNKVTRIAEEIRKIAGRNRSLHAAAQEMMTFVRNEFVSPETGKSIIPMARLFVSIPYKYFPADYKDKFHAEGITGDTMFLCLMGTAGENPDWNDIRKSKKRQAIRLPDNEKDFALMPMLARNFSKMGIRYENIIHPDTGSGLTTIEDYALEGDVHDSPYIPDQKFVSDYRLSSQIGVGGVLPTGSIFTSFLFFNEPVDEDFAGTFMVIPMALQMALKDFDINKAYWQE
jgi:methyl-accepting chemotaxis protein